METIYKRLELRNRRLTEFAELGKELLRRCREGGAPEEDLILCRIKLKQGMEQFEKELYQFLQTPGSHEKDIDAMTNDQMEAEDVLTELEALTMQTKSIPTAKLPKLSLPTYDGDRLKWNEFWDRFKSNIHQQAIADSDKLAYLMGCLTGVALETISGLSTTDANYSLAIDALEKRFGSQDALIDAHYTAITSLPKAECTSASCRSTLDQIECHLRVLEKLGEPPNGNHLRAMVLSKFPEKVIHEHHLLGKGDNSMTAIRDSLHRIVTAMEKSAAVVPISNSTMPSTSTTEALHIRTEPHPVPKRPRQDLKRKHECPTDEPPHKKNRKPCLFCKMTNHASANCLKVKGVEARKQKLNDRCHRCLRQDHKIDSCKRKISCFRCKEDHLLIFCPMVLKGELKEKTTDSGQMETMCDIANCYTFLQTAVVTLQNPDSQKRRNSRLLLDCGSQRSYITEKVAKELGLPILQQDTLLIYTFGATEPQKTVSPSTMINVQTKRGKSIKIQVNIVPRITDRIPVAKMDNHSIDILADDDTTGEGIDLLVGNDFYSSFMRDGKIELASNLFLLDTDFGWVISGNVSPEEVTDDLSMVTYCQCHLPSCPYFTEPDLPLRNIDIKFLWSLESIGITDSPKASREEDAVRHFNETVQYSDGRYNVKFPWIEFPPDLPSNFGLAFGRLRSILKRIDQDTLKEYDTILREQLELGIIEITEIQNAEENHPVHYLPHHIVKSTGKRGRIVYDASAKTTGSKSLNECLFAGPSMLEDLTALLIKFRTGKVGMVADVEKAFLQVGLQEEDRDVTRFLWIKDLSKEPTEDNLLYLRFCRVPFGVISSPFLLSATIRHHMGRSGQEMLKTIADRCYVDNLVTGADSVLEAQVVFEQTRNAFDRLSMNIRDWVSNNETFMKMIPKPLKPDQYEDTKVLGLLWDIKNDKLKLRVTESHCKPDVPVDTKRKVLRSLARIYDPCGFVCPLVLPMKIIFQRICETKAKWDTKLTEDFIEAIESNLQRLRSAIDIAVPRYIGIDAPKAEIKFSLHCFTDAAKHGYAAACYVKAECGEQSSVSLLMAKSHVSRAQDKDDLKIPKLELLGFLIGSRLLKYIRSNLGIQIEDLYLWTDSLVVLGWMKSSKLLPPFVANRVNEIKRDQPQTNMCYVHTKSNPADIATRPELFEEKRELWYNGPEFLSKAESYWPESRHYDTHITSFSLGEALGCESPAELMEPVEDPGDLTGPASGQATSHDDMSDLMECDEGPNDSMNHIEDISQPIETVGSDSFLQKQNVQSTSMSESVADIKRLQEEHFPDELRGKRTHLSKNLDLFLDVDGLLRCRGRMTNTTWGYDKKYPILLPRNNELSDRIINDTHLRNHHVGASHTLNIMRERYWIPQGKTQVQKVLRRCPQCIKHGGGPYRLPATPALPQERVNYTDPFTFTGIDYFGPLYVSTNRGKEKRWVALFTCLTVRAIHLEIVQDLSADECLLALRRFVAARGVPQRLYSDNATNFKLVSELVEKPYCIEKKIQWKFIPQLAPWHGGFYERLVALVKHSLKRTLEKHLVQDSKLLTVMKEVEAVVNTRPLTRVGTEVEHILRPADFLSLGKCLTMKPSSLDNPIEGTTTKVDLINSWKRGLMIMEEFKSMFVGQYLSSLRERYKHAPKQPRIMSNRVPQIGDLVQLKSDEKNRNNWKTGKIVSLVEGSDGKHRVAKVQVENSVLTRSVGHLYPLEVDEGPPEVSEQEEMSVHQQLPDTTTPSPAVVIEDLNPADATGEGADTVPDSLGPGPSRVASSEEQPLEVEGGVKRDAAVRARKKILEWTRLLLALLK